MPVNTIGKKYIEDPTKNIKKKKILLKRFIEYDDEENANRNGGQKLMPVKNPIIIKSSYFLLNKKLTILFIDLAAHFSSGINMALHPSVIERAMLIKPNNNP